MKRKFVKLTPREGVFYLDGETSCLCYTSLINRLLHNSKAVVRAVKLRVVVKRVTYCDICNNYRIIQNDLRSGPNTDKKCIMFHHIKTDT